MLYTPPLEQRRWQTFARRIHTLTASLCVCTVLLGLNGKFEIPLPSFLTTSPKQHATSHKRRQHAHRRTTGWVRLPRRYKHYKMD